MQFKIHSHDMTNHHPLISDCVPLIDGKRFAVIMTVRGLVFGESRPRCEEIGSAETRLCMVINSVMFRTTIQGKAYSPRGMQKLAQEFSTQCVSEQGL
jgi:hypothetical protein